jgi:hypothetical protein
MNGGQGEDEQRSQLPSFPSASSFETGWGIYYGKCIEVHGMIVILTIKLCGEMVALDGRDLASVGDGQPKPRRREQHATYSRSARQRRVFKDPV